MRELESCILRALIRSEGGVIGSEHIQFDVVQLDQDAIEQKALENALTSANGSIKGAAKLLGLHRNTVYNRMKRYGIEAYQYRGRRNQ